jgi:hypothetical protein
MIWYISYVIYYMTYKCSNHGILLDNSTDSSFFLLTPLDDTPYRRMGMSYQVEEIVVPALAHACSAPGAFTEPMQRPHYWPEDHCWVLVWSWVEHQTLLPILVLKRQLTLWTFTNLNWKYSMFVCSSPYRRMGMSYQVEEIVVPALAHVVGSGITVDCVM